MLISWHLFGLMMSVTRKCKLIAAILIALCASTTFTGVIRAQETEDPSAEAVALFNKGQDAHEKGDLATAIENYQKAIKLIPEFPEAELQKGNAYRSLGKLVEAEASFKRAVELREDWSLALAGWGSVLVRLGRLDEAERYLQKAIDLDELNFPAYAAMTELRLRTNADPKILRTLLSRVTLLTEKANPAASMWSSRAALELVLGDRKTARLSAARAIEIDPRSRSALATLADIALVENDPAAAEGFLRRLEAVDPTAESINGLRTRLLVAQGKPDLAIKFLDSVTNPDADILTLKSQIIASISIDTAELERQLAVDPKNATVLFRLCSGFRASDPTKALDYCRRASEVAPNDIQPAIGYAAALVQATRYEDAVMVFRRLLTLAPDNSTVRANLATALFQLKRYDEAKSHFRWLTEHRPDQAIAYYFLGIVHDRLLEFADAAANYQQFLRLANAESSKLEIEKVNLRLPALLKLIKEGKGKKRG